MATLDDLASILERIERKLGDNRSGVAPRTGVKDENTAPQKSSTFTNVGLFLSSLSKLPGLGNLGKVGDTFFNVSRIISTFSNLTGIEGLDKFPINFQEYAKVLQPPKTIPTTAKSTTATVPTGKAAGPASTPPVTGGTAGDTTEILEAEEATATATSAGASGSAATGGAAAAEGAASGLTAMAGPIGLALVGLQLLEGAVKKVVESLMDVPKQVLGIISDVKSALGGPALDIIENIGGQIGPRVSKLFEDFGNIAGPLGGMIGKAMGTVAEITIGIATLPAQVKNFAQSLLQAQFAFAEMSPAMSGVQLRWEMFSDLLNMRMGQGLSESSGNLEKSLESLTNTLAPYVAAIFNILNMALTYIVTVIDTILKVIEFGFEMLLSGIDKMTFGVLGLNKKFNEFYDKYRTEDDNVPAAEMLADAAAAGRARRGDLFDRPGR